MDVFRAGFLALASFGLAYFLLARRIFDVWSLAFLGAIFYFLPGFFGVTSYAEGVVLQATALLPGTYGVMALVFLVVLVCGILQMGGASPAAVMFRQSKSGLDLHFAISALTCGYVGCVLTVFTVGPALFEANKIALFDELNRWHLVWVTGASLALVAGVAISSRAVVVAALVLHVFDLYIGFRADFVLACLASVYVFQRRQGVQRLIGRWRVICGVGLLAVGMALFKYLLVAIQLVDLDLIIQQMANPELVSDLGLYSEPFVVQGTLNEVIASGFFSGPGHFTSLAYVLIPFANELGASVVGFNDLFQPTLFSSVTEFGLGSNIWAEMLASGNWQLLVAFAMLWALVLVWLQRLADTKSIGVAATAALLLAYWAFYCHRNDLLYQLVLTKRFMLAAAVYVFIAWAAERTVQVITRLVSWLPVGWRNRAR